MEEGATATMEEVIAATVKALHENGSYEKTLKCSNNEISALLPTFSGDATEDIENWLNRVEAVQITYGVDERIMQLIMVTKLTKAALNWYHSKVEYITMPFKELKQELCNMFASRPSRIELVRRYLATEKSYEDLKFSTGIPPQALGSIIPETCADIYTVFAKDYLKVIKYETVRYKL
ncbi:hypothetical protein RN001_004915 [Aquatica leii]|uniref:Retrotransposon gag domain-containing protein n=1 Tax=Aquatica leii TaxID=1421715 RepID=A0AAN7SAB1_9COLE|nr:hypothetical protein RN001_004915 [Aquatica leii]